MKDSAEERQIEGLTGNARNTSIEVNKQRIANLFHSSGEGKDICAFHSDMSRFSSVEQAWPNNQADAWKALDQESWGMDDEVTKTAIRLTPLLPPFLGGGTWWW